MKQGVQSLCLNDNDNRGRPEIAQPKVVKEIENGNEEISSNKITFNDYSSTFVSNESLSVQRSISPFWNFADMCKYQRKTVLLWLDDKYSFPDISKEKLFQESKIL